MDLKDLIIKEFNLMVDNLQNSFIEKLKKRMLENDYSTDTLDKTIEDPLPLKRNESSRKRSKLKKLSKVSDDSKEDPSDSPPVQLRSKDSETKPKKLVKIDDDLQNLPKDLSKSDKKAEEPRKSEEKPESKKTETKTEAKTEEKTETKKNEEKIYSKKNEEKPESRKTEEKKTGEKNPEQKPSEVRLIPKKGENEGGKSKTDLIPLKSQPLDEEKIKMWNSFHEQIQTSFEKGDSNEIYKVLLKFSENIDSNISEQEVKYMDKSLSILQRHKDSKIKPVKSLITSIFTRVGEKMQKKKPSSNLFEDIISRNN